MSVTVQQMSNQELVIERWVLGCGHQRSEIQMFCHFLLFCFIMTARALTLKKIKKAYDLQKIETESGRTHEGFFFFLSIDPLLSPHIYIYVYV